MLRDWCVSEQQILGTGFHLFGWINCIGEGWMPVMMLCKRDFSYIKKKGIPVRGVWE